MWGFALWPLALGFARIGSLVMLLPGIGEAAVPATVRMGFALLLTLLIAPQASAVAPDLLTASGQIVSEIAIGLALGTGVRILVSALATAGTFLGFETGLSFAQSADPTHNGSNESLGAFLSMLGVTLVLATNLHHQMLTGIRDSYELFKPGAPFKPAQFSEYGLNAFSTAFRIGLQIAAPVIVAGLVFRIGLGVLARLTPTIQVFFVAAPLNVLGGFVILAFALSTGMLVWLDALSDYPLALHR